MMCHTNSFFRGSQSSRYCTTSLGSFLSSLSPPCLLAVASAWSESIFRKLRSNGWVEAFDALNVSSVPWEMPGSMSEVVLPDQENAFIFCRAGDAKTTRHTADLPSRP